MTIDKTQLINNMKLSGYYSEVNIKLKDLSEGELNLISNFAPMIASKSMFSDTYNLDGKGIFDELMNLMALNKEELTRINENYNECKGGYQIQCHNKIIEQIKAANAYKEKLINDMGLSKYSDTIFSQINNLSEKELNLISNFAPIIASMDSNTGKDIFDKLIALNREELTRINENYSEYKNEIIQQIRNAYDEQIENA